ncbi:hypothetical protein H8S90_19715 [Olivibacter sp. SDN3]|uniref:hypothetical protein n=1 Tax=Olivibacter sp. SDN3 TaxID=2764720 RepID=UPI00165152B1|nr:hypothetical protein [Olivibacter sp. SDN3]QNL48959.1 hypothetical protein H8S90_19715 [Olivibacter sp. SDN3]
MNVIERAQAPTPKFFKTLRSIGLIVAAMGAAIATAPVALPAAIVTIGGYLTVAGGVLSAISQVTVDDKETKENPEEVPDE